jgi:hypothetical protein
MVGRQQGKLGLDLDRNARASASPSSQRARSPTVLRIWMVVRRRRRATGAVAPVLQRNEGS